MFLAVLFGILLTAAVDGDERNANPPHCTNVTKDALSSKEMNLNISNHRLLRSVSNSRVYLVFFDHAQVDASRKTLHCPTFPSMIVNQKLNWEGTDYVYHYRFDYPVAYIHPGQKEVYQQLYCINPPAVSVGSTIVCDWAAPPQVQFTLGDDYMHVVRQDPAGKFAGNAIIWTYQLCTHNHLLPEHYVSNKVNITKV